VAYELYYDGPSTWEAETSEKIKELWRRIISQAAPHVQYATTGQGVPLSDREILMVRKNYGVFLSSNAYTAINAVLVKRNVAQPVDPEKERFRAALERLTCLGNGSIFGNSEGNTIAQEALRVGKFAQNCDEPMPQPVEDSQPVDEDVIERMLVCIYGPKCGVWEPELRRRMTEAAHILLDALRGPVTYEESKEYLKCSKKPLEWVPVLIDRRIDRILKPKEPSAIEKVVTVMARYDVIGNTEMMAAEIIAALKEENHAE